MRRIQLYEEAGEIIVANEEVTVYPVGRPIRYLQKEFASCVRVGLAKAR